MLEEKLNDIFDKSKNIGEIATFGHIICKEIRENYNWHISPFLMRAMNLDGTPFFGKKLSHFTANKEHFKTSVVFYDKEKDDYETINMTDETGKLLVLTNIVQAGKSSYLEIPMDENYFLLKAISARISHQCQYYYRLIKDMLDAGIKYPEEKDAGTWPTSEKKNIEVNCFEIQLNWHLDENDSLYKSYKYSQDNLVKITNLRNLLIYKTNKIFGFYIRCYEYWLYKNSGHDWPTILDESDWEFDVKLPRKRILWNQLMVTPEITLRCRFYKKTI